MNALFIYPEIPDTFWGFKYALEFVSKKSAFPPLGLLTVAAMVPPEWKKTLVDMNVRDLTEQDLIRADYAFISAMHIQKESVRRVVGLCREYGIKTIAGGPYFTTSPDDFNEIDHVVLGEAELTLPELVKDLERGCAQHTYTVGPKPDLAFTPLPCWDLIDFNDYDSMLVQFSRGCPFDCEFCDIVQLNGRKQRTKTSRMFIRELNDLHRRGWRGSVFIVDDNFIGARTRVKQMLTELVLWMNRHGRPFRFFTEASIDLSEEEDLMELMAAAGFCKVFIGIESPSRNSLEEAGKIQNTRRDLLESIRIIQLHGLEVMGGFILGFDHDEEDIFDRLIEFIQRSGITVAMVGLLEALTGTRLWKRLKKEGRLLWEATGNNTDGMVNYVPKMDRDALIRGYRRVLDSIYSPAAYYRRCLSSIRGTKLPAVSFIGLDEVKALFKSIWRIGVKNEEGFRKYYWKLLLEILVVKPRSFGDAVRAMIMGLHLRKTLLRNIESTVFAVQNRGASLSIPG